MSMHDEFERAISGASQKRKGMSALAWLFASLGLFVVLGVVGVGFAMNRVAHKVEEMLVGFDYDAPGAASKVVARLESHTKLLSADPDQGMEFLRTLDGDDPAESFLSEIFDGSLGGGGHLQKLEQLEQLEQLDQLENLAQLRNLERLERIAESGSRSVRTRDGDATIDLRQHEDGGSLVIRSDDGEVRLDLQRTDNGGSLVINTGDGEARIGLQRTDDGGFLTVDSDEGSIRFELIDNDDGGQLLVDTDDGEALRLAFGNDANALPRWVPQLDGMPKKPRPVYSLSASKGVLGAAAWTQDVPAQAALEAFRSQLEDEGYDIRVEHHRDGVRFDEGSLWAKDEASGRLVFVVAHEADEGTRLLVGYGEESR